MACCGRFRPCVTTTRFGAATQPMAQRFLGNPSESSQAPEHIAKIVIDRVQALRRWIDRSELDDEALANHPIAERPFGRVGAVPREMNRLAVALAHARLL